MKKFLWIFFGLALISFNSCDNMFQGKQLKDALDEEIEANNCNPAVGVERFFPTSTYSGVAKNSTIIIDFTWPMDTESVYNNLSIYGDGNVNLMNNFNKPTWDNNNKRCRITTKHDNPLTFSGQTYEIHVSINKSAKNENQVSMKEAYKNSYTVNNSEENPKPELKSAKLFFAPNEESVKSAVEESAYLLEGEINASNQDELIAKNHINGGFGISCVAEALGGNSVGVMVQAEQITDVEGNQPSSGTLTYTDFEENEIFERNSYFGLSSKGSVKCSDGLYKLTVRAINAAGEQSETSVVYYVVRDTVLDKKTDIRLDLPKGYTCRQDSGWTVNFGTLIYQYNEDSEINMENANEIEDVFLSYGGKKYSSNKDDLKFIIKWSTEKNNFSDTQSEEIKLNENGIFHLSENFLNFKKENKDKGFYSRLIIQDKVLNEYRADLYTFPKPDLAYCNFDSATNKVTLKVNNKKLLDNATMIGFPSYKIQLDYEVYYCKKNGDNMWDWTAINTVKDIPNTWYFNTEPGEEQFEIPVDDANANYIVGIYLSAFIRDENWKDLGITTSSMLILDNLIPANIPASESIAVPEIQSYTLTSPKEKPGICEITATLKSIEDGVTYIPAFAFTFNDKTTPSESDYSLITDCIINKENKTVTFEVPNILRLYMTEENVSKYWDASYTWKKNPTEDGYAKNGFIKICASKNSSSMVYSEEKEIKFESTLHDNIAPLVSSYVKGHDLSIDGDGKNIRAIQYTMAFDNELHLSEKMDCYYTDYKSFWGNSLSFYKPDEIENLIKSGELKPCKAKALIQPFYTELQDVKDGGKNYNDSCYFSSGTKPQISLEGLADGNYMFFGRFKDTYGNNSEYGALGKFNVSTYKNAPALEYNSGDLKISFKLENESRQKQKAGIQYFDSTNIWQYTAIDGSKATEFIHNFPDMTLENNTLMLSKTISDKGKFYRVVTHGYNEDSDFGAVYEDWCRIVTDGTKNSNSTYDAYTEEIESYPAYIYVPKDGESTKCAKKFFSTTEKYGVLFMCDKPVLVEYIRCNRNLSENISDSEKQINEWEKRGTAFNTYVYNDSTGPFTQLDLTSANSEEGTFYYVIVLHFADGTSDISSVYKKN